MKAFNYLVKVHLPIGLCKLIFDLPGLASTGKLIIDTFDQTDSLSPEKVGAAILLIQNRPEGWKRRIETLISSIDTSKKSPTVIKILFEAVNAEYLTSLMSIEDRTAMESLTADLIVKTRKSEKRGQVPTACLSDFMLSVL